MSTLNGMLSAETCNLLNALQNEPDVVTCHVILPLQRLPPNLAHGIYLYNDVFSIRMACKNLLYRWDQMWLFQVCLAFWYMLAHYAQVDLLLQEVYSFDTDLGEADVQLASSCALQVCQVIREVGQREEGFQELELSMQATLLMSMFIFACLWQQFPQVVPYKSKHVFHLPTLLPASDASNTWLVSQTSLKYGMLTSSFQRSFCNFIGLCRLSLIWQRNARLTS